jgi:uncharacterized membrane protein
MTNEMIYENQENNPFRSDEPGHTPGQAEGDVTFGEDYSYIEPGRTPGQAEGERDLFDEHEQVRTGSRQRNGSDGTNRQPDLAQTLQDQFEKLRHQIETGFQATKESSQWKEMNTNFSFQNMDTGEIKRWASLIGGGFLALYGLRRSLGNLTLMGVGAGLVYYALTGQRPLSHLFGGGQSARFQMGSGFMSGATSSTQSATTKNIIVRGTINDVYQAWANFENFPRFMQHIQSVTKTGDRTSHWVMEGPFGTRLEWDAETTRLEENKRIAWSSTSGDIKTSGQVTFNSLPNNEVEVTVMLKYVPPAGMAGEVVANLFGDPEGKLVADLRNFKRYIEGRANQSS